MFQLCQELIWTGKTTNTYCMRKKGHAGKHNIINEEPCEKKTPAEVSEANQTG